MLYYGMCGFNFNSVSVLRHCVMVCDGTCGFQCISVSEEHNDVTCVDFSVSVNQFSMMMSYFMCGFHCICLYQTSLMMYYSMCGFRFEPVSI